MRPERIVLLRHGESEANLDETLYERKPDHRMELTARGRAQAAEAAEKLSALFGEQRVQVYCSPYARTLQTVDAVRAALGLRVARVYQEPRLREQDWGNLQDRERIATQRKERDAFGHFFYRLERGESGADVYDRVSTFLETLHRDFERDDFPENALLVTHGLTTRLFLMRWFHWSVEYFESLENPRNGELFVMQRQPHGPYALDHPLRQWKPSST